MLFLIDGYNFIHSIPAYIDRDQPILEILDLLFLYVEHDKRKKCRIVFDGNPPPYVLQSEYKKTPSVRWDFSGSEESADDYIQIVLENLSKQNEVCLVTNDKGLKASVQTLANSYESCEQFYTRLTKGMDSTTKTIDEKKNADTYSVDQWLSLFQKKR